MGLDAAAVSRAVPQCWVGAGLSSDERGLVRADSGVTSLPSPAVPIRSLAGHMLIGAAWLLCPGLACLLPSLPGAQPYWGYSTLQVRSFFQPLGCGSCTQVGTPLPSLPLPVRWSISAICYLDSSSVGQRLGQHKPDSSYLPALCSHPRTEGLVAGC